MKALTARQQQILDYISTSIRLRGYPPTIREIGKEMDIRSTNGVNDHLKALERKGYLRRDDLKSRAMRPINPAEMELPSTLIEVPILGKVAAGQPILAVEQAEDRVTVDRFFVGGHREIFALRIVGESMIEDGILDGDYIFVKKTSSVDDGAIVVAMVEGEATCKRLFRENDTVRLQPANPSMNPIFIRQEEFRDTMIIGLVVGLYRRL